MEENVQGESNEKELHLVCQECNHKCDVLIRNRQGNEGRRFVCEVCYEKLCK